MASTQYQHYIPQFMLRRFAVVEQTSPSKVSKRNRKSEKQRRNYHATVKVLHLRRSPPEITDEFVRRTFGQQGMYNDGLKDRVEAKLGEIEREVARIIARVVDAQEAGKESIPLLRYEKDLLRKFQFVMKYRSPIFFHRFNHQTAEDYNSDDKEEFLEYMLANDFQSPLEVWLDNLTKMIDIPMDPDCHWIQELRGTIYPPDADWFISNFQSMYMAFVTPSDPQEEFILTQNAFSIHEGPVSYSVDRFTGEKKEKAYTEFHLLTIITPRLAIVFRSNYMPEPLEDLIPEVREWKTTVLAAIASIHTDPEHTTSLLEDLPIAKPRNSYTTVRNGLLELAEGADGEPKRNDKFDFIFFRLKSNHAQKINMVMLDQACHVDELVFKSKAALRLALEFYLEYPCLTRGLYSMKTVSDEPDDPRLRFLKHMEHVARTRLGSSTTAKYHVDPLWEDDEAMPFEMAVAQVLATTTDTPEKDCITLGMEILVKTLEKMGFTIMQMYEVDQTPLIALPTYPDFVYQFIQETCRKYPGQRTDHLLKIDHQLLMLSWEGLVKLAMKRAGKEMDGIGMPIRQRSRHFSDIMSARTPRELESPMKPASWSLLQVPIPQQDSSSGFFRQGLNEALEDIGRHMEREETSSSAQSPANQSPSHSTTDFVESKEESYSAQQSEEMKAKGEASLDDAFTVTPVVLPNNRYRNTTPLDWKLNIFCFVFLLPALPLMWLAFTIVFRALVILSFVCAPTWLAFHKGALDVLQDQEPLPTHLKFYILHMSCTVLWWFACYWFWLPDLLLTELPSGLTVACLLVSVINAMRSRPDPW